MSEVTLVFPHQLFEHHPAVAKERPIHLLEHPRYFSDFAFHKQKLILHRATMKRYHDVLKKKGYNVNYVEYSNVHDHLEHYIKDNITALHYVDLIDVPLEKRLHEWCQQHKIEHVIYTSPAFLTPLDWAKQQLTAHKTRYNHNSFYIAQRKRMKLLLTKDGKPAGGSWSFDKQNREPLPDSFSIPKFYRPRSNAYIQEAGTYIKKRFPQNPGNLESFYYPTTFTTAKKWLKDFLHNRLYHFGRYQDALNTDAWCIFHSVLSPLLNCGLLTPDYVVKETLTYAQSNHIALNSLEGFIRQVVGWREFVRAVYSLQGEDQRTANYFNAKRKMPASMWQATTGIEPIDHTVKKLLKTAYGHHIERLMVLGNFMQLCSIHPHDVYSWFMEFFIDAYDWVMVPNVYGMSQYADGGLMTSKPYCSSSRYLLRMSNYKKGPWCSLWDALYWHFLITHQHKLKKNPRMALIMGNLKKISPHKKNEYAKTVKAYFKSFENVERPE